MQRTDSHNVRCIARGDASARERGAKQSTHKRAHADAAASALPVFSTCTAQQARPAASDKYQDAAYCETRVRDVAHSTTATRCRTTLVECSVGVSSADARAHSVPGPAGDAAGAHSSREWMSSRTAWCSAIMIRYALRGTDTRLLR